MIDFKTYVRGALLTESTLEPLTRDVEERGLTNRLFHSIAGISTEVGEIQKALYQVNIDKVNVMEEIGDVFWYLAILSDELNTVEYKQLLMNQVVSKVNYSSSKRRNEDILFDISQTSFDLLDHSKKVMFYGKSLDLVFVIFKAEYIIENLIELANNISEPNNIKVLMRLILSANLSKLKLRYPNKFSTFNAEVRDLDSERLKLEDMIK
jgi:NTP pyrophosphatase (non-canonical NTP hydrolase)